jgi:CDP-glucose 4,6-dehydratase
MTKKSFFANKYILVTGASGLLGSWLIEELLNQNAEVTGISLDSSKDALMKSKNILDKIENYHIDISKYDELEKIVTKKKYSIIFHLAAQTQVTDALKNPLNTLKSNVEGTWNLLEICRLNNLSIVSASSDKAYGESSNLPYLETHPLNGVYPYEVSKSASDLISTMYKTTYDLNVATLRCGNIYGGGDLNWDRLIPGMIECFLKNKTPILRTSGDFIREWVYVKDVANAYIKTAISLLERKNSFTSYNFSSGDSKTVMEIYEKISKAVTGEIIEPKIELDSDFEIKNQELDSERIKLDLGIESEFNFDDSIKETIDWYRSYFKS